MDRRDFLGLLGKGAIVCSMPLSAKAVLNKIESKPIGKIELTYQLYNHGKLLGVGIEIKQNNDMDYRNAVLMGVDDADPNKMIDVLWDHLERSNPVLISGLRKPTAKEHLQGIERYLS